MKLSKFTIIFFSILCYSASYAQKGGSISAGVTPGLSYMLAQNTYYLAENSKELDYKAKFSYHAFLQGGYNFKEEHGIVAYGNFCSEGQKYKDEFKWKKWDSLIGTHRKTVDFKYMGFGVLYRFAPVLAGQKAHVRVKDDNFHWRMKLLVGFEVDFLIAANIDYKVDYKNTGTIKDYGYPIAASLGGYAGYSPNPTDDYKSFYNKIQGVGVIKYGFDYVFSKNAYIGFAIETKIGFNDINSKAYRTHPNYKKSKNYFLGLNMEIGYNIQRDKLKAQKKEAPKKAEIKPAKTKTPGIDRNKRVDEVDKSTKKKYKK